MSERGKKPEWMAVKQAWRQQQQRAPRLSEPWLRRALRQVYAVPAPASRLSYDLILGLGASAAISLLIFMWGNSLFESSWAHQADLETLLSRDTALSMFMGEWQ